ncbi:CTP synthase 2-like [Carica papaya]|uniref:CTP synthase 2-like n=1 Tax=Carica papaya TaxID=3649 RepID=UPI000B8CCDD8|nr:CTP synthase 2-like [Carica papaya]
MNLKLINLLALLSVRYGNRSFIDERHRHRYEVNPSMISRLEGAGLSFTGKDETGQRMEIVELPNHPYYIGVQFHPEFKSRPRKPSALFLGLIAAASGELEAVLQGCRCQENVPRPISNGTREKVYRNGNVKKHASIRCDGVYSYCNGVYS